MKKIVFAFSLITLIASCGSEQTEATQDQQKEEVTVEGLKSSIKEMDDSLKTMYTQAAKTNDYKINKVAFHEAINRNKAFYEHFPNDEFAETAVDKIAALYLQINVESEAAKWRDTLISNFPITKEKIGILELQLNYYDYNDYKPEKIKHYANLLLDIEGLPEEKREAYEFRLKHIDKTFEELIEMQASEMAEQSKK